MFKNNKGFNVSFSISIHKQVCFNPITNMFHTLNAARVLAEEAIVHYHISFLFPTSNGLLSHGAIPDNLMSFFFVLSGFVAMHSNMDTDFSVRENIVQFISKRFRKTYGLYLFMFLADLPATAMKYTNNCALFWVSLASQPILLHSWLGSQHIAIANGVGWYICTLYWIWIAFPFMPMKQWLQTHTWPKIIFLYVLSILLWVLLSPFNIVYTRAVPIFRLPEFAMGCATAFTTDNKLHGVLCCVGLATFFAYAVFDYSFPDAWPSEQLTGNCTLWIRRHDQRVTPTIILSKFSIVWALLIHWLAATELAGTDTNIVIRLLDHELFRSLSQFSLHVYLTHYTMACAIRTVSQWMHVFSWWDIDTLIITVYALAYATHKFIQPTIDDLYEACHDRIFRLA